MKKLFILALICSLPALASNPTLPTLRVDNNEAWDGTFTRPAYELALGSSTGVWITGPPSVCPFTLTNYVTTATGLQDAVNDIEACRTTKSGAIGIILDVPPGLYASTDGLTIPQTATAGATAFLVIRSTQHLHLPNGTTVCSHGIQDNLASSLNPGLDNPQCSGSGMYYQLGTTLTNVSGSITLANGTVTNASNYNDAQYMWTDECPGSTTSNNCAPLNFCSPTGSGITAPACGSSTLAPDHWFIEDGEIRMTAANTGGANFVSMTGSNTETSTTQLPNHIHFRHMWVHGDWTDSSAAMTTGKNQVSDCFALAGLYVSVLDSQCSENLRPGGEGHSILSQGPGPYKYDNNWMEGESSGSFSGGFIGAGPSIANLVPYCNVEMRRNRFTFPYNWLGLLHIPSGAPWAGQSLVRKNANENKEGCNILYDGNIFENVDNSGAQDGPVQLINTRNSSGPWGTNYQSVIHDVTVTNNIGRNTCQGIELDNGGSLDSGQGVTFPLKNILFQNNLYYNMSVNNPGCTGTSQYTAAFDSANGMQWQGTIVGNGTTATFTANCSVQQGGCLGQVASIAVNAAGASCVAGNLTFSTPAITGGHAATGTYTCSSGALSTVTLTAPGNGYSSAATATLATGTGTVTVTMVSSPLALSATTGGFNGAGSTGFQVFDISVGDPIQITMCTSVTGFNATTSTFGPYTWPAGVGPASTTTSTLWNGSWSSGMTTASWLSSTSGTDSAGYCTFSIRQGNPQNLQFVHNTMVSDNTHMIVNSADNSDGPTYTINALIRNDIFVGASNSCVNNTPGSGTATEVFDFDITTFSFDHSVCPANTASSYTEYGNNPSYPDTAGCTGAGCSPPTTIYFPTTSYTTGASCTAGSVCFKGSEYKSASSMVLAPSDYHDLALDSTSSYYAGAADDASDSTSMGIQNVSALDAAQTLNTYPGGFPDTLAATAFMGGILQ